MSHSDRGNSFKNIDPTPAHQSAHPKESNGTVSFSIKDTEEDKENTVSISEITTRHLRRLKQSAADFLGKDVNAAVITVPTNFADKQKEALSAAAKEAGVEVLQFIHEPVAAVLAYDARPDAKVEDKVVVVLDIGGIRTDATVIASRGGMYSILAATHDYDVSGTQLDQVLIDYFSKEFMKKHKTDPRANERSLAKLKLESEAVKKALSLGQSATFSVESLADGVDYTCTVNRTRFELLANKHLASLTRLALHAVEKAELDPLDISEIILAGGSSHTPKIARNLQSAFPESVTVLAPATSSTAINPSELAVRGAAIQASLIQEFEAEDIEQSTHPMVTVAPHLTKAIGVLCISGDENGSGVFRPLIEAETPVPVRRTATIAVPREGGDVLVKIAEGDRQIKVTKPEAKPKEEKKKDDDDSDDDDSDVDSDEEPEEVRERVWKANKVLAEAALKSVKKGGKVEVQVNVAADLAVTLVIREVGGKGGVRGQLSAAQPSANGSV